MEARAGMPDPRMRALARQARSREGREEMKPTMGTWEVAFHTRTVHLQRAWASGPREAARAAWHLLRASGVNIPYSPEEGLRTGRIQAVKVGRRRTDTPLWEEGSC